MNAQIQKAIDDLRAGKMVLVFDSDDRERETDMVIASTHVTPGSIRTMRKDGGGLICTGLRHEEAVRLGLPFLADVFAEAAGAHPVMSGLAPTDIPYDVKSAFSITINHRGTYTGITDNDRALTVSEFAKLVERDLGEDEAQEELGRSFRAPGHIHLLRTTDRILENRFGHTELSVALVIMAGMAPVATICEMMGDDGGPRSKEDARLYAEENGLVFLEGREVIEVWRSGEW